MRAATGVRTHEDVALVLIDYQKEMFESVRSETTAEAIELNVRFLIRIAKTFGIPVILALSASTSASTVRRAPPSSQNCPRPSQSTGHR